MDVFDRKMGFISDTLARVAVRQEQAAVRAAEADRRMDRLERQMKGIQTLVKTGMRWMVKVEKGQTNLDKKMKELAESRMRTDAALRRWIAARNGSNGHKKR
jgi:hypothetical protein